MYSQTFIVGPMTLKVFGDDVFGANISTLRRRVDALHMDNKEMKFKE